MTLEEIEVALGYSCAGEKKSLSCAGICSGDHSEVVR